MLEDITNKNLRDAIETLNHFHVNSEIKNRRVKVFDYAKQTPNTETVEKKSIAFSEN